MRQSYDDILDAMTKAIRDAHFFHYRMMEEGHEGKHPECTTFSYDSVDGDRCCSCAAMPTWFDEHGVPRFAAHHPDLCADIYATEVALLLIGCQACGREFPVQLSWSMGAELMQRVRTRLPPKDVYGGLADTVRDGSIHYGDPPTHDCATGVTMNCWDLRVLEFWSRNRAVTGSRDWQRIAALEIDLPDLDQRTP